MWDPDGNRFSDNPDDAIASIRSDIRTGHISASSGRTLINNILEKGPEEKVEFERIPELETDGVDVEMIDLIRKAEIEARSRPVSNVIYEYRINKALVEMEKFYTEEAMALVTMYKNPDPSDRLVMKGRQEAAWQMKELIKSILKGED